MGGRLGDGGLRHLGGQGRTGGLHGVRGLYDVGTLRRGGNLLGTGGLRHLSGLHGIRGLHGVRARLRCGGLRRFGGPVGFRGLHGSGGLGGIDGRPHRGTRHDVGLHCLGLHCLGLHCLGLHCLGGLSGLGRGDDRRAGRYVHRNGLLRRVVHRGLRHRLDLTGTRFDGRRLLRDGHRVIGGRYGRLRHGRPGRVRRLGVGRALGARRGVHAVVGVHRLDPVVTVHDGHLAGARGGRGLAREAGHCGLGGVGLLGGDVRTNRFGSRCLCVDLGRGGRGRAPGGRALRRHLAQRLGVEVLGAGGLRPGLPHRRSRGAAVGQGADRARRGVGDRRAEVQRPAWRLPGGGRVVRCREDGRRGDGDGARVGQPDTAEVDRAAVAARRLVRSGLVDGFHHRLRSGWRNLVAPRALGTRQQQVFVLGRCLGEVGVRTVRGGARLLHHACALRLPLARDLAGVGHAYPSPIGLYSYDQLTRNGAPTAPQ